MYASKFFLPTLREDPAGTILASHKLMIRSGMLRRLASGLYSWLPLGLRVFRRVEDIVRQEMSNIDALEMRLPCLQPSELWKESGRWKHYGPELLRLVDRHKRDFCLGPTHEEVITDIIRNEISSHKQLPLKVYQMHTKFRDEIRPRFGVMRGREFAMKDAYSFNVNQESLQETYQDMRDAYLKIFTRLGVEFKVVAADTGSIGGSRSEEFHVLADCGEDAIAFSEGGKYAANVELVPTQPLTTERPAAKMELELVDTPGMYTIKALQEAMGFHASEGIKTMVARAADWSEDNPSLIALLLRGDRVLNAVKAEKLPEVGVPFTMASAEEIVKVLGCKPGSLGPVNLNIPYIADYEAGQLSDFVCGANQQDKHYKGVNWQRDCPLPQLADLRNITAGEDSPEGDGKLQIKRGIEVGHIFELGDKYSKALNAYTTTENGDKVAMLMGCYGIGIDRVVAACIEQNNDDKGIIWPREIAPFDVMLIPLPLTDDNVIQQSKRLYDELTQAGISVLFDDRDLRAGNKFANCELIGIPYRLVVSTKSLEKNSIECKARNEDDAEFVPLEEGVSVLKNKLADYSIR